MRTLSLVIVLGLLATTTASAQSPDWRFNWQQGQVLHYRVEHTTDVLETVGTNKSETKAKIDLIKRWEVLSVDTLGIATVRMSIVEMRNEQTRPNGEVLLFDSRSPDKSTPELREQMTKYIGQPLAVLRVDAQGRVVEVKQGVASRYEAEPPFALTLPPNPIQAGQSWKRDYGITVDPPQGSGVKHAANQQYQCAKIDGGLATLSLATAIPKLPESKTEQLPLLQKLPQGEVVFDLQRGRLESARLVIDREIQGHQGENSSYRYSSSYTEQYVERN